MILNLTYTQPEELPEELRMLLADKSEYEMEMWRQEDVYGESCYTNWEETVRFKIEGGPTVFMDGEELYDYFLCQPAADKLIDYYDRKKLYEALSFEKFNWDTASPEGLSWTLYGKVCKLVDMALEYQGFAFNKIPEGLRGMELLKAIKDARALRVLVGGEPVLMAQLIPALKQVGCVPMYAVKNTQLMREF